MKTILYIILLPLFWIAAQANESIAVMDLDGRGISTDEVLSLSDRLRSALVRTGKATVVERGQMKQVLAEQDFQLTGCTSNECAIEIGQLLGVTRMVAGSIGKVGSTYSIDVRIIDIQTGRIVESYARDYRGEIDGLLNEMKSIAESLVGNEQDQLLVTELPLTANPANDGSLNRGGGKGLRPAGIFDAEMAIARRGANITIGDIVYAYRKDTKRIEKGLAQRRIKSAGRVLIKFQNDSKAIPRVDAIRAHVALKRPTSPAGLRQGDKVILYYRGFKRGLVSNVSATGEVTVRVRYGPAGGGASRPVIVTHDQLLVWSQE